jgi:hypothetical protein
MPPVTYLHRSTTSEQLLSMVHDRSSLSLSWISNFFEFFLILKFVNFSPIFRRKNDLKFAGCKSGENILLVDDTYNCTIKTRMIPVRTSQ